MPLPFEFIIDGPPVFQQARRQERVLQWKEEVRRAAQQVWPADEEGVKLDRYAPSYMLKRAVSDGIISREEYAFFIRAMEYRNALVHGFSAASFDTNLVRKLIALIKQMIGHATAVQSA